MTTKSTETRTAPCGCTFKGRFVYSWNCQVIDKATWTGTRRGAHFAKARKEAK